MPPWKTGIVTGAWGQDLSHEQADPTTVDPMLHTPGCTTWHACCSWVIRDSNSCCRHPPIDAGCDVTWSIFPLEVAVIYFCHPLRQKHHSRLFAQGMGRGALMAKLDIEAAYHTVSAHPQYHLLLGVQCHDFIHIDGCLPFGLWSALKIFTAIAALATFVTLGPKWPSHTTANSQGCCINPSDPRVSQLVWVVVDTRRQRLIVSLVPEGVSLDWILQTLQMGGLNWKSISWLDQISIGISSLKKTCHGTSGPVAIDTRLGWVLSGLTSSPS